MPLVYYASILSLNSSTSAHTFCTLSKKFVQCVGGDRSAESWPVDSLNYWHHYRFDIITEPLIFLFLSFIWWSLNLLISKHHLVAFWGPMKGKDCFAKFSSMSARLCTEVFAVAWCERRPSIGHRLLVCPFICSPSSVSADNLHGRHRHRHFKSSLSGRNHISSKGKLKLAGRWK